MAKQATTNRKTRTDRVPPGLKGWVKALYQRGILGLLLVSLSLVTFLGLIQDTSGVVIDWWSDLLLLVFGWGSFVVILVVAGIGVLLLIDSALFSKVTDVGRPRRMPYIRADRIPWRLVIGGEIVFLALLGLTHLASALQPAPERTPHDLWQFAQAGRGGGYVGAVLSGIFYQELGALPTGVILGGVLFTGLFVASGLTLDEWVERLENGVYRARRWAATRLTLLASRWPFVTRRGGKGAVVWGGAPLGSAAVQDESMRAKLAREHPAPQVGASNATGCPLSAPTPSTPSATASHLEPKPRAVQQGRAGRARSVPLPSVDLLEEPDEALFDEADIRDKARVIEETLDHFGVPAKVVEINWGPRVTQFGVEPGYVIRRGQGGEETERKIRVAKITSLSNDLALALAAAPVRVEAPVPGRSIVGIEVPNSQVSQVSLRRVIESSSFKRRKSALRLALGEGVAGTPVVADLVRMPHLLIAGATGSGKSVCINAIAACLLFQNSPYTLRIAMIDPKRVELSAYNGVPHLYGQVESDVERIVGVLRWLVRVMEERYKKFAEVGARHLDDYNRHWRVGSSEYLPRVVVMIDELADMMFFAPEEVEHSIIRLAQMARATGMHLVIATQRPSVDVVTGLIKANFPARIGFAVTSNTDSRVILDAVGAETLLSKGDMLYMAPDAAGLLRLQGCFVSDQEVARVVNYWRVWAKDQGWAEDEDSPWERLLSQQAEEQSADDLLGQAIEIVRQQGNASASLLQRRMHIGYPRASRLIDEMEERGIVGPAESGGRQRQVLTLTVGTMGEDEGSAL
jgi:S-DNA-T family DNA segregation ATPase FtsK/SpoIIIE